MTSSSTTSRSIAKIEFGRTKAAAQKRDVLNEEITLTE